MDRKKQHEDFVTGFSGGPISDIYACILCCVLSILAAHFVLRNVRNNKFASFITDFVFNWVCTLLSVTLYANKHTVLAAVVIGVSLLSYWTGDNEVAESHKHKGKKEAKSSKKVPAQNTPPSPVARRDFVTVYRSAMMVLTITAILAVDFPVFPRRFAKAETWGTSLMDLGVGSFVFSMGLVTARQTILFPTRPWKQDVKRSLSSSANLLVLGFIRLALVKSMDYHEHVSEYGVHWNFFFTLGFLPAVFSVVKRIPWFAVVLAVGYELVLKNTGLMEWVLIAPRTGLISQNKEGISSFVGYLSIFIFGHMFGRKILPSTVLLKDIIRTAFKWTSLFHLVLYILTISTDVSRRLANLPYIMWVVAFNSGLLFVLALFEYLFDLRPSATYTAVNKHGNTVFLLGNMLTGLVNLSVNTITMSRGQGMAVLLGYQLVIVLACEFLNRK